MNKWFSVDEKLPPSGEEVIVAVCDESGDTPYKYTASGMMAVKDVWIVDKDITHSVTHWMPFPSYPSEKEVYKIEDGTLIEWKHKKECLEELNKLNTQLFEISQKMEQGILIELPCKVGDTVYRVVSRCSDINSCNDFDQHICGRPYCNAYIRKERFNIGIFNCIGKSLFLTREEAEIALAQLKGE